MIKSLAWEVYQQYVDKETRETFEYVYGMMAIMYTEAEGYIRKRDKKRELKLKAQTKNLER